MQWVGGAETIPAASGICLVLLSSGSAEGEPALRAGGELGQPWGRPGSASVTPSQASRSWELQPLQPWGVPGILCSPFPGL